MDAHARIDIADAIEDRMGIERACIAAARDVIKIHRFHCQPVVTWRDGAPMEISVEEFEESVDRREAELNASLANKQGNQANLKSAAGE